MSMCGDSGSFRGFKGTSKGGDLTGVKGPTAYGVAVGPFVFLKLNLKLFHQLHFY